MSPLEAFECKSPSVFLAHQSYLIRGFSPSPSEVGDIKYQLSDLKAQNSKFKIQNSGLTQYIRLTRVRSKRADAVHQAYLDD